MAGLGFAVSPEQKKAQRLALMSGASTIPTMPMTSQQAPTAPAPQAQAPQPLPMPNMDVNPQSAALPGPTPQAQDAQAQLDQAGGGKGPKWTQIAGAIGHIILSADAGYHGRPMPEYAGAVDVDEQMRVQEFIVNTTARAWQAVRQAPPESRAEIIRQYSDIIKKVEPSFDFEKFLHNTASDSDWVDEIAPDIATMSEGAKSMFMARVRRGGGDPATASADVLKDQDFMNSLRDFDDQNNSAAVKFKLQRIRGAMTSMNMGKDPMAGMSIDDLIAINSQLPKGAQLTPSEIATLKRHPDMGGLVGMNKPVPSDRQTTASVAGYDAPPRRPQAPQVEPVDDLPGDEDYGPAPEDDLDAGDETGPVVPAPPPRKPPATPTARTAPVQSGRPTSPAKPQGQPYYPPGWKPRTPATPAYKRGKPAAAPAPAPAARPAPSARPAARQQPPAAKPQTGQPSRTRRVVAPRDMDIPDVGRVKKGEAVIYDYTTGTYRRA